MFMDFSLKAFAPVIFRHRWNLKVSPTKGSSGWRQPRACLWGLSQGGVSSPYSDTRRRLLRLSPGAGSTVLPVPPPALTLSYGTPTRKCYRSHPTISGFLELPTHNTASSKWCQACSVTFPCVY